MEASQNRMQPDPIADNMATLLIGMPFSGKHGYLHSRVGEMLQQDRTVIWILTDRSPEGHSEEFSGKIRRTIKDRFFYIDCYSHRTDDFLGSTEQIKRVPGPAALNEISIVLSEIMKFLEKKGSTHHCLVFDSLSTMLLYNPFQNLVSFLQTSIAKMKMKKCPTYLVVEEGMHSEEVIVSIEHLVDDIVFTKAEDGRFFFRKVGSSPGWYETM